MDFFCSKKIVPLPKIPKKGHVVRLCNLDTNSNLYNPEDIILKSNNDLRKWFRNPQNLEELSSFYGLYNYGSK